MPPTVRYAMNAGVHLAYRVDGDGPPLLMFGNFATNIDTFDSVGVMRRFMGLLGSVCRSLYYDQRGTGMSDRSTGDRHSVDALVGDALAVLDDAGVERAAILGNDFSGPLAIAFAARHPDRTDGLVLWATYPSLREAPDYPLGIPADLRARIVSSIVHGWGDPDSDFARRAAPGRDDSDERRAVALVQRQAIDRAELRPMVEAMFEIDVRDLLAGISAPTLVLHRRGDALVPVAFGRYLAEHIPAARLIELPGDDHYVMAGDVERVIAEISRFVGGRPLPTDDERAVEVVVFVDIADSTTRAASAGDLRWRRMLDEHDGRLRDYLELYGGRAVKWLGDGLLATFVSPSRAIGFGLAVSESSAATALPLRVGIHAGEVERRGRDLAGLAVHIAQRIEATAAAGEVLVSRTVRDLVAGSALRFADRGHHALKGVPEEWQLFAVTSA